MSNIAECAVVVENLRATVGERTIVDDVSLRIAKGEALALVGPSGSGKSTTARALLGEVGRGIHLDGSVRVVGERVSPDRQPAAGLVGYVPQHPGAALTPTRKVGAVLHEVVARHCRGTRSSTSQHVREAMLRAQITEVDELLDRYPHQLSGGQQQRVVLAQMLACDPSVIVVDEPTTAQDASARQQLVAELRSLADSGIALLVCSHDLTVVSDVADRVAVMCSGAIVEDGPTDVVLREPSHQITRRLVASRSATEATGTAVSSATEPELRVRDLEYRHRRRGARAVLDGSTWSWHAARASPSSAGRAVERPPWPAASPGWPRRPRGRFPSTANRYPDTPPTEPTSSSPGSSTSSRTHGHRSSSTGQ